MFKLVADVSSDGGRSFSQRQARISDSIVADSQRRCGPNGDLAHWIAWRIFGPDFDGSSDGWQVKNASLVGGAK